jgi:hypothetical protein
MHRHCERSEAIQAAAPGLSPGGAPGQTLDRHGASRLAMTRTSVSRTYETGR